MKAKKIQILLVISVAALLAVTCLGQASSREESLNSGGYEGIGRGFRGPIHVLVQISHAGIEDILIIRHRESPFPGLAAMEELLDMILETGSTDLDAISGATFSSRGFLEAVENALYKSQLR